MTQKVFIFDMDGVLIRSEQEWIKIERDEGLLEEMFGKAIADKIAGTVGIAIGEIYKQGIAMGAKISKDKFMEFYEAAALKVYRRCQITPGTKELVTYLKDKGWLLALASSSPKPWIKLVLDRLDWKDQLSLVLSVNEHPELKAKPAPDGYQYILKTLGASAPVSIALEDSNPGIVSAKAAGLLTIGYTEHLVDGYEQKGADVTAKNMDEVLKIIIDADH